MTNGKRLGERRFPFNHRLFKSNLRCSVSLESLPVLRVNIEPGAVPLLRRLNRGWSVVIIRFPAKFKSAVHSYDRLNKLLAFRIRHKVYEHHTHRRSFTCIYFFIDGISKMPIQYI